MRIKTSKKKKKIACLTFCAFCAFYAFLCVSDLFVKENKTTLIPSFIVLQRVHPITSTNFFLQSFSIITIFFNHRNIFQSSQSFSIITIFFQSSQYFSIITIFLNYYNIYQLSQHFSVTNIF